MCKLLIFDIFLVVVTLKCKFGEDIIIFVNELFFLNEWMIQFSGLFKSYIQTDESESGGKGFI